MSIDWRSLTTADHHRLSHMVETIGIAWIIVSAAGAVVLLATSSQERVTALAVIALIGVLVVCAGRLTRSR